MEYIVDLGGHPPYHQPPEGFRLPHGPSTGGMNIREGGHQQGPFSSDSGSDADSSMTSTTTLEAGGQQQQQQQQQHAQNRRPAAVDKNRNFTS